MDTPTSEADGAAGRFGTVTVEANDLPPLLGLNGQAISGVKYVWHPSREVAQHLPDGFTFALRALTGPDGLRRFYPASFEGQIAEGFQGGLALLTLIGGLSPEQQHSYRAMYLLFERVRRTREHLGNALLNATSLRVSRVGRDLAEERNLLPASLGTNARGEGEPWGVDRLLQEGREAAAAVGITHPGEADCTHYGLIVAARRNPLRLPEAEVLPLVRLALYESLPCDDPLDPELLGRVTERTLGAMHAHLLEPAAAFSAWFSGPKNSFVQQVTRRKRLPGGVLPRDLVRRALLELGWQAYQYVADCLHALMRVFQRRLPEPLTAAEERWFEQMHLKQSHLGNLPLVLLVERFAFLRGVLWEIWENPDDPEPIAVLHRLLSYYGEMASSRRSVDRRVKQRRPGGTQPGEQSPLTVPLPAGAVAGEEEENLDVETPDAADTVSSAMSADAATAELFGELAELVRQRNHVRCDCALPSWDDRVVRLDDTEVTMAHACAACGLTTESTLPLVELKRLAEELTQ